MFTVEPNKNRKQTPNGQLSPSYEREQSETATKKVKTRHKERKETHTSHKQQRTDENTPKGDVNREQYRSPDKGHGTTGRQQSKPIASAKDNGPGHNSYGRTA